MSTDSQPPHLHSMLKQKRKRTTAFRNDEDLLTRLTFVKKRIYGYHRQQEESDEV